MLALRNRVSIPAAELEFSAIRAQGAGGQHVNKTSTAIQLRFDVKQSSLPQSYKERILACGDRRLSSQGVIVIKAQRYRSQEKNRRDAMDRLAALILDATQVTKTRRPTKPTAGARARRMDSKTRRGQTKSLRGKVSI